MFDMFRTVLKNFFSKPATRMYPFEKRPAFSDVRGQVSGIDVDKCIYCGLCQRKCPALAITVDKATKTWSLDPFKCIICGVCVEACPKKCIAMDNQYRTPVYQKESVTLSQPVIPVEDTEETVVGSHSV